jgi:hypothetical protein
MDGALLLFNAKSVQSIPARLLLPHHEGTAHMGRVEMATINEGVALSRVEEVAGGNADILRFARLKHDFRL